jgi:hypothetical protein
MSARKNLLHGVSSFRFERLRPWWDDAGIPSSSYGRFRQALGYASAAGREHHQFEIVDIADDRGLPLHDFIERRSSACPESFQPFHRYRQQ